MFEGSKYIYFFNFRKVYEEQGFDIAFPKKWLA